ncbi:FAD-dependent oxidoreductase [Pseudomonas sp. SZMC_28357]|uniref:FAD-dependent oxidoreductase n=1 Tax=Pseudomonas sp. SZMC_28357 TaxID=3074380 RepID=UPI00287241EF|nr:FAD-dependent oxidoreductase [Pseudomonas sp. SZMC_28357]MDR9751568.1 FAD-dependent oxidoreductase [Pseudomonas sp. SZMC_28357]
MSDAVTWDVIVLGGGAAGLVAAFHARQAGASVLVVNKGLVGRSGATITSGGGVSIAGESLVAIGLEADASDTEERFLQDTLAAGSWLNDQHLVQSMVSGIGAEVQRLIDWGIKFSVNRRAPGHSSGRGVHISGIDMQRALTRIAQQAGVSFREDFQSSQLLRRDGAVVGVLGLDRRSGSVDRIFGNSTVLATGGATSNWSLRTAPEELSGEGQRMAVEAGATLIDMEMMQFLPCCLAAPALWRGLQFPWILGPQSGVHAWLMNRFGERFMARWDPVRMELATRDMVSAACATEVYEGRGSPNGGVYLSWKHLPNDIIDHFPATSRSISADWQWEGFDMTPLVERIKQGYGIEVAPAAHFSLGGVRVDAGAATGVPGLFACGEVTGAMHGANRLSGNAGAQVLVQGRVAGQAAALDALQRRALDRSADNLDEAVAVTIAPFERREGIAPFELKERLSQLAERALGPVRTAKALNEGLNELTDLRTNALPQLACRTRDLMWNRDWSDALECQAAFSVIESALLGAIGREHSIGAHQRHDHKAPASGVLSHSLVTFDGGALRRLTVPVAFPLMARP